MNKWKVSSNVLGDKKVYCLYKILDKNEIDHSGNREVVECFDSKKEAEELAKKLNEVD